MPLTRFDFNLDKRELTINKATEFVKGQSRNKAPKTPNSYRTVPIPDKVFPVIERFVKKSKGGHLFRMRNGKPMSKSSYDKMWARILRAMQDSLNKVAAEPCKENGIEVKTDVIIGLTAHVFRHNYCTNLCYQIPKVSIKKIAQLMGDTESMVLDVYNHMILEKEDAAGAVGDALNF